MSVNQRKKEINNFCSFKDSPLFNLVFANINISMFPTCWRAQVAKYDIYYNGFYVKIVECWQY